jgi:hypothetical protein
VQLIQEVSITATDWLVFAEFQEAVLMPIVPGMIRCAPGRYKEVKQCAAVVAARQAGALWSFSGESQSA